MYLHFSTTSLLLASTCASIVPIPHLLDRQTQPIANLSSICTPLNSTNLPDLSAPCNALQAVQLQCIYGPEPGLSLFHSLLSNPQSNKRGVGPAPAPAPPPSRPATPPPASPPKPLSRPDTPDSPDFPDSGDTPDAGEAPDSSNGSDPSPDPPTSSEPTPLLPDVQRNLACGSQFFDLLKGCSACYSRFDPDHPVVAYLSPERVSSISSGYCSATPSPTVGLGGFLSSVSGDAARAGATSSSRPTGSVTSSSSTTPTISGGSVWNTSVGAYFTASLSGDQEWRVMGETVVERTITGGSTRITRANTDWMGSPANTMPKATMTGRNAGARETGGMMGVVGLMGVAALL